MRDFNEIGADIRATEDALMGLRAELRAKRLAHHDIDMGHVVWAKAWKNGKQVTSEFQVTRVKFWGQTGPSTPVLSGVLRKKDGTWGAVERYIGETYSKEHPSE